MGFSAIFAAVGALASVYTASQSGKNQPPMPTPPQAPVASQAALTPEQGTVKRNIRGVGSGAGADPTLLTGPGGVPNDLLTLGRSTLLGS